MEEVLSFKCPGCGNLLYAKDSVDGLVECDHCGEKRIVPRQDNTSTALYFMQMGEHDLDNGKFDEAYTAYSKAAELSPKEPEAYWGMALAKFKVRYIKDMVNNRLQPICYEVTTGDFARDRNYEMAIRCATAKQREEYQKRAGQIDYIKQEFYRLRQSQLSYDCFICVKVTNDMGEKTDDSKDADYIYDLLKRNGYSPFYSEREIRNRQGADYEAMILYALHTAETMLIVCHDEHYLQTKWVKNEYSRFLKLQNDEEKEFDSISIIFKGKPIERLDGKKGKIQGIDFSLREADEQILKFVQSHTVEARARREEAVKQQIEKEEEIRRQIEESRKKQQDLEDRLKNMQNRGELKSTNTTVYSLFERGSIELANADFNKAAGYFNRVLDADPKYADAWWGLFLCEFGVSSEDALLSSKKLSLGLAQKINKNRNIKSAINYCLPDNPLKEKIGKFLAKLYSWIIAQRNNYNNENRNNEAEINNNLGKVKKISKRIEDLQIEAPEKPKKEIDPDDICFFIWSGVIAAIVWMVFLILTGLHYLMITRPGFNGADPTVENVRFSDMLFSLVKKVVPESYESIPFPVFIKWGLYFKGTIMLGIIIQSLPYGIVCGIVITLIYGLIVKKINKSRRIKFDIWALNEENLKEAKGQEYQLYETINELKQKKQKIESNISLCNSILQESLLNGKS